MQTSPHLRRSSRVAHFYLAPAGAERRRFQGMLQIIHFNWPWYAAVLGIGFIGLALLPRLDISFWPKAAAIMGLGAGTLWAATSLLVSHWVYDISPLSRWDWIAERTGAAAGLVANIHAGFDEMSGELRRLFPEPSIAAWDIYRPAVMTEPSIARARRGPPSAVPATVVDFRNLPAANGTINTVFLIFAAHEIRSPKAREAFFRELSRILRPDGNVLLVEHLRDWKNFLAYGPGFLHFLARREWLRLAAIAGFGVADEFAITPFVRVLHLLKSAVGEPERAKRFWGTELDRTLRLAAAPQRPALVAPPMDCSVTGTHHFRQAKPSAT